MSNLLLRHSEGLDFLDTFCIKTKVSNRFSRERYEIIKKQKSKLVNIKNPPGNQGD